jgi:ABC-type transporter Mla maintaining outer membrane lipid asymmetry ATPase subunit MlaF
MILHVQDLRLPCESETVIENISFTVDEGECVVINTGVLLLGTCLLQALAGVVRGVTGSVVFQGNNLAGALPAREQSELRKQIGFVYRHGGLISLLNVTDNIALPLAYHYNVSRKELADNIHRIATLLGVNELLALAPEELNVAQTRLVNLARALVSRPRLLLIDAILDGISLSYKQAVIDAIRSCQTEEHFAVVMTTRQHRLSEVASAAYELTEHGLERSPQ